MSTHYLTKDSWKRLLSILLETYDIYALKEEEGGLCYDCLSKNDESSASGIVYGGMRAVQPLKSFFHLFAEDVSDIKGQARKRIITT